MVGYLSEIDWYKEYAQNKNLTKDYIEKHIDDYESRLGYLKRWLVERGLLPEPPEIVAYREVLHGKGENTSQNDDLFPKPP